MIIKLSFSNFYITFSFSIFYSTFYQVFAPMRQTYPVSHVLSLMMNYFQKSKPYICLCNYPSTLRGRRYFQLFLVRNKREFACHRPRVANPSAAIMIVLLITFWAQHQMDWSQLGKGSCFVCSIKVWTDNVHLVISYTVKPVCNDHLYNKIYYL